MSFQTVLARMKEVPALKPVTDRLEIAYENPKVQSVVNAVFKEQFLASCARMMVSLYFLNVWYTALQTWYWYRQPFPTVKIFLIIPVVGLVTNFQPKVIAIICMVSEQAL